MATEELLKDHSPSLIATGIGLLVLGLQWLLGREVKRRDTDIDGLKAGHAALELRVRDVEIDRVRKGDIDYLNKRLDQFNKEATDRHLEVLDQISIWGKK